MTFIEKICIALASREFDSVCECFHNQKGIQTKPSNVNKTVQDFNLEPEDASLTLNSAHQWELKIGERVCTFINGSFGDFNTINITKYRDGDREIERSNGIFKDYKHICPHMFLLPGDSIENKVNILSSSSLPLPARWLLERWDKDIEETLESGFRDFLKLIKKNRNVLEEWFKNLERGEEPFVTEEGVLFKEIELWFHLTYVHPKNAEEAKTLMDSWIAKGEQSSA